MCVLNEEKFKVSDVNKLDGTASINHHKGKFTFFYEWSIKRNWTGTSGVQYKGHVEIPNCLMKIEWMKWRLVWALPEMSQTQIHGLKESAASSKQSSHRVWYCLQSWRVSRPSRAASTENWSSRPNLPFQKPRSDLLVSKSPFRETFLTSPEELYRVVLFCLFFFFTPQELA